MAKNVQAFVDELIKKGLTISIAESMTCGLASSQLGACIGTSEMMSGAVICYDPDVKTSLFRIPQELIDEHTCESMEVTEALAKNLKKVIGADIYAAVTGLASPGGSETKEKPVGTVFLCVVYGTKIRKVRKQFKGTPLQIRKKACNELYKLVLQSI